MIFVNFLCALAVLIFLDVCGMDWQVSKQINESNNATKALN